MSEITLELKQGPDNPRNSEAAFFDLADGRILHAYTKYVGDDGSDQGYANIVGRYSTDGGKTWTQEDHLIIENDAECNVVGPSFLRLSDCKIAIFYGRKTSFMDTRIFMRTSEDEGETWSQPTLCIPAPGYYIVINDRIIQLKSGRIIIPAAYHRNRKESTELDWSVFGARAIAIYFYSDDEGQTWKESRDWWALPVPNRMGLQEPGVIQLNDGRLYSWCRTDVDYQWEMYSEDEGDSWTPPQQSQFKSPCSPLSMKRIPSTGDLLAVWNETDNNIEHSESSWGRTPLVLAISNNEGKTWKRKQVLEDDPERGFCYVAIHFADDAVLLGYCCGGIGGTVLQDSCVRRIELDEIY